MSEWDRELKDSRVLVRAKLNVYPGSKNQDAHWIVRAADEIERQAKTIEELEADNERLRAAMNALIHGLWDKHSLFISLTLEQHGLDSEALKGADE